MFKPGLRNQSLFQYILTNALANYTAPITLVIASRKVNNLFIVCSGRKLLKSSFRLFFVPWYCRCEITNYNSAIVRKNDSSDLRGSHEPLMSSSSALQ